VKVPPGKPQLTLDIGNLPYRPWRLQVFVDDTNLTTQMIGGQESIGSKQVAPNAGNAVPVWRKVTLDLSGFSGKTVTLRLYDWVDENQIPGAAYWKSVRIE
jgi:hypothetical protein